MNGSAGLAGSENRYICIRGFWPSGARSRWSWYLPRKYSTWTPFWLRLVCQEFGVFGSHEHWNAGVHRGSTELKSLNGKLNLRGPLGVISSVGCAVLSSLASLYTWATLPASRGESLGSQPALVRSCDRCTPPAAAPG